MTCATAWATESNDRFYMNVPKLQQQPGDRGFSEEVGETSSQATWPRLRGPMKGLTGVRVDRAVGVRSVSNSSSDLIGCR